MKINFKDVIKASIESEVIDAAVQRVAEQGDVTDTEAVALDPNFNEETFIAETTQALENLLEQIEVTEQAAQIEEKEEAENGVLDNETEQLLNAVVGSTGVAVESEGSFKDKAKVAVERFIEWVKAKFEKFKEYVKAFFDKQVKLSKDLAEQLKSIDKNAKYEISSNVYSKKSKEDIEEYCKFIAKMDRAAFTDPKLDQRFIKFGLNKTFTISSFIDIGDDAGTKVNIIVPDTIVVAMKDEKTPFVIDGHDLYSLLNTMLTSGLDALKDFSKEIETLKNEASDIKKDSDAKMSDYVLRVHVAGGLTVLSKITIEYFEDFVKVASKAKKVGD